MKIIRWKYCVKKLTHKWGWFFLSVSIEIIGIDETIRNFRNIDSQMIRKVRRQVVKSSLIIETRAKREVAVDTGRLRSSIQIGLKNSGLNADIFSDVNYANFIEFGTRPHRPPASALKGWARRHNMDGMESVIAKSIERKGTKARPFLVPAFESEKNDFINELINLLAGLGV